MAPEIKVWIQRIEEMRSSLSKRYGKHCDIPVDVFWEKTRRAFLLLDLVENSKTHKDLKLEARKNFIINCVTALEVFLKDMLVGLLENVDLPKLNELLNEKITLWEAYKLFYRNKVSAGELIAIKYSLQNLEQINLIFSKLIEKKFLTEIGSFDVKDERGRTKFVLDKKYPDWKERLAELFELRHRFVHQISFNDKLGLERLRKLWECLTHFVEATEQYLFEYIPIEENDEL